MQSRFGYDPGMEPLRSVHTQSFPAILSELGISLLVSTYQSGRLTILRADKGVLNTHFRSFPKPMGLAVSGSRLAVGCGMDISEFQHVPFAKSGSCDAVFLPRRSHFTGDVQIREMVWAGDDLLFVNSRFSCICRRSDTCSFEPVWRPHFVKSFAADDRCHLNGICAVDGRPRYATAVGACDGEWRAMKREGGVVVDVERNEIVLGGLSMPHSPRWHQDKLWVLNSGIGGLGYSSGGRYRNVATLPGFTRGLCFCGSLAFVGLSQVRESSVFDGIEVARQERACGVWIVDVDTGESVGCVKFEDEVQEIFAVEVLQRRFPDVVTDDKELLGNTFVLPVTNPTDA